MLYPFLEEKNVEEWGLSSPTITKMGKLMPHGGKPIVCSEHNIAPVL
jgi:hypothetical protein